MNERPIPMCCDEVRATLDGHKKHARRIMYGNLWTSMGPARCPYGEPGDRLWVREAFAPVAALRTTDPGPRALADGAFYAADYPNGLSHSDGTPLRWTPSVRMPRALSRLDLEIVSARVERLQDITEEEARLEGVPRAPTPPRTARHAFEARWDRNNGERGKWATNPRVWVISFERIRP